MVFNPGKQIIEKPVIKFTLKNVYQQDRCLSYITNKINHTSYIINSNDSVIIKPSLYFYRPNIREDSQRRQI